MYQKGISDTALDALVTLKFANFQTATSYRYVTTLHFAKTGRNTFRSTRNRPNFVDVVALTCSRAECPNFF